MLHQFIRYRDILGLIAAGGFKSVLEVGSGSAGIAKFSDLRVVGVDMDFKDYTPERRESPANLVPVMADAAGLPFANGAFDLVFSCDMLEHVPPENRPAVVLEMVRVASRKAVLVFPCGRAASALDRLLRKACIAAGRTPPGWLEEHIGLSLPTRSGVAAMLDAAGLSYRLVRNGFIPVHYVTLVLESNARARSALSQAAQRLCGKEDARAGAGIADLLARAAIAISGLPPAYRAVFEIDKAAGSGYARPAVRVD